MLEVREVNPRHADEKVVKTAGADCQDQQAGENFLRLAGEAWHQLAQQVYQGHQAGPDQQRHGRDQSHHVLVTGREGRGGAQRQSYKAEPDH